MFQTETSTYISYIHSYLMLLFLLVFAVRISFVVVVVVVFFFPRGARGHAAFMLNDPFSDLPFFLVVRNRLPNFIPRGSLALPDFPGLFKFRNQNGFQDRG